MTTEVKERMGILYNIIQIPSIGEELRSYAESNIINILKSNESKEQIITECSVASN